MKHQFGLIGSLIVVVPIWSFGQAPSQGVRGAYTSGFSIQDKSDAGLGGDYADRVLDAVRKRWYPQIAELRKSTDLQRGVTRIAFEIKGDGSFAKIKVVDSSGFKALDRIAKQAITSSAPFERLPDASRKNKLRLHIYFGYNQPVSADAPLCDGPNWGAHLSEGEILYRAGEDGVQAPQASYSPDPEFSEEARKAKYGSEVTVAGTVDEHGAFTDLCVAQAAGLGLDEKAIEAVRNWRFQPATREGKAVPVRITVETTFRIY